MHAALLELLKTFNYGNAGSDRVGEKASSLVRRLRDLANDWGELAEMADRDDDSNGIEKSLRCVSLFMKVVNGPFYKLEEHFYDTAFNTDDYETHKNNIKKIKKAFTDRYGNALGIRQSVVWGAKLERGVIQIILFEKINVSKKYCSLFDQNTANTPNSIPRKCGVSTVVGTPTKLITVI